MTRYLFGLASALAIASIAVASFVQAGAAVPLTGVAAPAFTLLDMHGREHSLADYKGKFVVLEWLNHDCPFVKKHYNSGNMQSLQKKYTEKGVVWLSIISSAPGKQGHCTPDLARTLAEEKKVAATTVLFDLKGEVGRAYSARTTPHMFVIDPSGTIIYNGAIDDKKSADVEDIATAKNYVAAALDEAMSGNEVSVPASQPYGCSVKY